MFIRSIPKKKADWIKRRIRLFDQKVSLNSKIFKHFINVYLELDGLFLIRLIADNSSEFVATELSRILWNKHQKLYESLFPDQDDDDDVIVLNITSESHEDF